MDSRDPGNNGGKRLPALLGLLCFLLLICPASAKGAELSFSPTARLSEEYDDNVFITETNKKGDFLTTLTPAFNLNLETERARINPRAEVGIFQYVSQTERNRVDQRYGLGGMYQLTERAQATADLSYAKEDALYSILEQTGEVTTARQKRDRRGFATGFSYAATPISDVGMNWTRQEIRYSPGSPSLVDYSNDTWIGTYQRKLASGVDSIAVQPYYSKFDADISSSDSLGISFGWTRSLYEVLDLKVFAGVRHTESEFTYTRQTLEPVFPPFLFRVVTTKVTERSANWGWVADMSLTKRGESYTASVGYTRDLDYSTTGDPLTRNRFFFSLNRVLGPRLTASLYTSLLMSKSVGEFTNTDTTNFNVSPSLAYRLTEDHSLVLSYAFSRYLNNVSAGEETIDRNRVWLALVLQFPKKWSWGI